MYAKINSNRRRRQCLLGTAALIVAALLFGIVASARTGSAETAPMKVIEELPMSSVAVHLPVEGRLPSLSTTGEWLNSQPLTPADLRGNVVLVEFWTYSCINWRRQLPYVRTWADRYKAQGLVVIGVHAPEFSFERNVDNVRQAAKDMRIEYPIVIDNDHAIWRAFNNEYWPALYFVDAKGRIRHHQFGEGEYRESEIILQQLLAEAGHSNTSQELVADDPVGAEAAADWSDLRSGENYVGYGRTENFASPGGPRADKRHDYVLPGRLKLNHWALSGANGRWEEKPLS